MFEDTSYLMVLIVKIGHKYEYRSDWTGMLSTEDAGSGDRHPGHSEENPG